MGHKIYNTPYGQKISSIIKNSLTVAERKRALSSERYQLYKKTLKDDDLVFEEFVCDILGGMSEYTEVFADIAMAFYNNDTAYIDNYKASENHTLIDTDDSNASVLENIGFGNDYSLSEGGELDGYGKENRSGKLGRLSDIRSDETSDAVDKVGHVQQKTSNTPHTKSIHRSGVSAEVITSSGYTAEQAQIKAQNKVEGRVDYADAEIANKVMESIDNGRINRISDIVGGLSEWLETRQGSYSIYNAYTKKQRSSRGVRSLSQK